MINIDLKKASKQINYNDRLLLMGSCFTEHIGHSLEELKFPVLQNPNGILFDTNSVCRSLVSYIRNRQYNEKDFFLLNQVWHSWDHHSRYSNTDLNEAIKKINSSQLCAHDFLKKAGWVVITLGSSFSYRLNDQAVKTAGSLENSGVANCHRAPAQWFAKYLMTVNEMTADLQNCLDLLFEFNPALNILFTVSPVRHIRDGVVENNRSKSRLIETVHHLAGKYENVFYFPSYEIVIDVLRDYRFYDADLVHPNYMATEFVLEKFIEVYIEDAAKKIMQEVRDIVIARNHKAFQPETA
ncbi:MAG TPA: GSCFA domain-containing protein, partial [Chitinophagaceae bacterium]|nr:GSCFA domain-containing protein [Chitinophagaceae bacterium]